MSARMQQVHSLIRRVPVPCEESSAECGRRLDCKTKPRKSLGQLERLAIRIAGMQRRVVPQVTSPAVVVMAADHGVVAQGVSAYPQEVTAQMVANFEAGGAAINVLTRSVGAALHVVDMGIANPLNFGQNVANCSTGRGTADFTAGPAMSADEAYAAILAGAKEAAALIGRGVDLIGLGEMGIGNTTSAAAIACALLGEPVEVVCGRGTGIDDAVLAHKREIVRRAVVRVTARACADGFEVLCNLGGFEIAGLVGVILHCSAHRVPVVVDGVITAAAALVAVRMAPACRDYLVAAHVSVEPAHRLILAELGLRPLLDLEMRLGEGSGAALAIPLVRAACAIVGEMASFEEAHVTDSGR